MTPDSNANATDPTDDRTDAETLRRVADRTPTRLDVGRAGPRPPTDALLEFREDHGLARDAVFSRVDDSLVDDLDLVTLRTRVADADQYLARPDLGRELAEESITRLHEECSETPGVQIVVSDGLSSTAVETSVPELLPVLKDGLAERDIDVGTPVFVEFGRVDVMDVIGEELAADCCVILIGERPGLRTAESLSAYFVYGPERGGPTAEKSVVSNIHDSGLPPVEAGAELVDLLANVLEQEASGIDLREDDREFETES
ncbi:ethanolamine ammonia-lyase small subunit [Natrialba chahannaoensis JCM 10990]|uniref:Putative ethanolamine ammonia-lyase small subunit n=1 Tax=Natrialba chahannaoensis JCM 10990 TaxID=1227492 RepID=M0B650_9EURY|nr:ethanolamine ammonia-lyase subunit EutC [Natrialba chahannaoensis]ELZ06391.1 ethanolamine ammonia-lyase small subunit [Natrialba chahannaoensis JCM 10990]